MSKRKVGFKTGISWKVRGRISVGCPKRGIGSIFIVLCAGCADLFWNDPMKWQACLRSNNATQPL